MTNCPSYAQLEGLVEFLEQNPSIAKGFLQTNQGILETKRKWALATSLNSLGGANRNGQGWAKYWAEKKCGLKKQCAELSAAMTRTGDGGGTADNLPVLSALENRLVAVMGGQEFATGDSWIVHPLPQSTRPTDAPVVTEDSYIVLVQEDTEMHSVNNIKISPIPGTSHNDAIPASSTIPAPPTPLQSTIPPAPRSRRRRSLPPRPDANMEPFASIEARRTVCNFHNLEGQKS